MKTGESMKRQIKHFTVVLRVSLLFMAWLAQPAFAEYGQSCDRDAQCDDGLFCNGVERCVSHECVYGSQPLPRHRLPGSSPSISWRCDEDQDRFVLQGADADGDGHDAIDAGGDDCDDNDPNRFHGNVEVCNYGRGHDEDCDPTTTGFDDRDGDGYSTAKCFNIQPDGSRLYPGFMGRSR